MTRRSPAGVRPLRAFFIFIALLAALLTAALPLTFSARVPSGEISFVIRIDYPGSFESEVERILAVPLEEALSTVPGIVGMVSSSERDRLRMHLVFSHRTDETEAYLLTREKIFSLEHRFPPGVRRPLISHADPRDRPVFVAAFPAGDSPPLEELRRRYEAVEGAGEVLVSGGNRREIHIVADPEDRADVFSILRAVRNAAASGTFGSAGKPPLWMRGRPQSIEAIRRIRLGPAMELGDLPAAGFAAADRVGSARLDGGEVIIVSVRSAGTAETEGVCRRLRGLTAEISGGVVLFDEGEGARKEFRRLLLTAVLGWAAMGIPAAFVLRRPRRIFPVLLNLPFSAAAALAALTVTGRPLDSLSLSAIIAGSGMVLVRGVLILGSSHEREKDPEEPGAAGAAALLAPAASGAVREAALLSAAASLCPFASLLFASPDLTRRFTGFALASAAQTAASLACIYLFSRASVPAPGLRTVPSRRRCGAADPRPAPARPRIATPSRCARRLKIPAGEGRPWDRRREAAAAALFLLPCGLMLFALRGGPAARPRSPAREFLSFTAEFPGGTPLSRTEEACRPLEERLSGLPGVVRVWTSCEREKTLFDLQLQSPSFHGPVREAAEEFSRSLPEGFVHFPEDLDGSGAFPVLVTGPDLEELRRCAEDLAAEMGRLPGVRGAMLHYKEAPLAKVVSLDPGGARRLGVSAAEAAERLHWALSGPVAEKFFIAGEEMDLRIFPVPSAVSSESSLLAFPIPLREGGTVRIGDFAEITEIPQTGRITRTNRSRSVSFTIMTEGAGSRKTAGLRLAAEEIVKQRPFPPGVTARALENRNREDAALWGLTAAVVLSLPLAALVLVFHYENLRMPGIVLCQAPLCAAAALLPTLLRGGPVSAPTVLGMALVLGPLTMHSAHAFPRRRVFPDPAAGKRENLPGLAAAHLLPLAGILPLALGGNDAALPALAFAAGAAAVPASFRLAGILAGPDRRENPAGPSPNPGGAADQKNPPPEEAGGPEKQRANPRVKSRALAPRQGMKRLGMNSTSSGT